MLGPRVYPKLLSKDNTMKTLERKVTASKDGKILYLKVDGATLCVPWRDSYYYKNETVLVVVEKVKDVTIYCVRPGDTRLPRRETHWKVMTDDGVPSETNG